MGYSLLFLYGMLQAQKLLKVEEVVVKVEEEQKGEVIVGSSREALRPLGIGSTFHPDKVLPSLSVFGQQAPSSLFMSEAFLVIR